MIQEKRYESGILRWVTNQLTLEFNELLKHKALSKVIHNMQVSFEQQDLHIWHDAIMQ